MNRPALPYALAQRNLATDAASHRAMMVGMGLSAVVHFCLFIGMSLWKGRETPPVIYAVTLVSPSAATLTPSVTTKSPVSRAAPPPPPAEPSQADPPQDDSNSMQAWWEKQARSLKKKRVQQAKLTPPVPPSKVEKMVTNQTKNSAVETPASSSTPVPAQTTPTVEAPSNAILQTGTPETDRVLLENPSYFSRVQNKIDQQWVAARSRGDAASAIVLFTIQKNGTIRAVQVEQPSGDWLFDQAALRAVQEASPLPPLPPGLMAQVVHYRFVSQTDKTP